MKLIVGLGNPGLVYGGSRHNIGFMVVKSLARSLKIVFKRDSSVSALIGKTNCGRYNLVLALPQTFMNLSGIAVRALLKKYKVSPQELLVVCDDLDLELGRVKIRPHGSSGGQRGMASIIEHLGTQEFNRLRIGIGRPKDPADAARYVLAGFLRKEKAIVEEAKEDAVRCCLSWVEKGIIMTMDSFNTRSRNE
ncbi:MAG: aminoacyl-tRNA hydrolase [Candidatus Omnitrophica bacterium]|nr:aminoacyl-tRNA hydrolase [Candidatus Omnitrophota bacterium]MDD5690759.1 aminoacyl-tRNA hydrolase [Candidatus Omnitrophota bacterium]